MRATLRALDSTTGEWQRVEIAGGAHAIGKWVTDLLAEGHTGVLTVNVKREDPDARDDFEDEGWRLPLDPADNDVWLCGEENHEAT